jgi:predicted transcriptional regulator
MNVMATTTFTTRMDVNVKARLDDIAKYEDRSVSYVANKAIEAFVDERDQTRALIKTGIELIDKGAVASSDAVNAWLDADEHPLHTRFQ